MNIQSLSDQELQDRHAESRDEIQRRHDLARIPEQVRDLSTEWCNAGEDAEELVSIIRAENSEEVNDGETN